MGLMHYVCSIESDCIQLQIEAPQISFHDYSPKDFMLNFESACNYYSMFYGHHHYKHKLVKEE